MYILYDITYTDESYIEEYGKDIYKNIRLSLERRRLEFENWDRDCCFTNVGDDEIENEQ